MNSKQMHPFHLLRLFVHQRLSTKRIHGEQFSYDLEGINPYVQITKEINTKLESQLENENSVFELGQIEDNGKEIKCFKIN